MLFPAFFLSNTLNNSFYHIECFLGFPFLLCFRSNLFYQEVG